MDYHFNVEAASTWGVDEAIFISNLAFWIVKNAANGKNFKDGVYWTYNTRKALTKLFPFWSQRQLERITRSCTEQGLIQTAQYGKNLDHTTWYSVTPTALSFLDIPISPNGEIDFTERGNGFHQTVKTISPNGEIVNNDTDNYQIKNQKNKAAFAADVHAQAKEIFAEAVAGDPALMPMVEEFLAFRKQVKPYKTVRGPQMAANKLRGLSGDDHAVMAKLLQRTLEREWMTFFALPEDEYPSAAAQARTETGGIRFL